jgi:hypothetical protein
MDIPREATGMLPRAMRERAGLEAEAIEDIGETGRIRSPRRGSAGRGSAGRGSGRGGRRVPGQARGSARDTGDGAVHEAGTRRRRRTRAGREVGGEQHAAQPLSGESQARQPAQRRGGRRKAAAREENAREENRLEKTRRKAS